MNTVIGFRLSAYRFQLKAVGDRPAAVGDQLSAFGRQRAAGSHQPSAVSVQLSAKVHRPKPKDQRPKSKLNVTRLIFLLLPLQLLGQASFMTFNIRYDNPADAPNDWNSRKIAVATFLQDESPDFLGIQEGLHNQVLYIDSQLNSTHRFIGVGRDSGDDRGEYCALFYNFSKYTPVKIVPLPTTLWLSQTPHRPSRGWDAALPRIATIGQFRKTSTGKTWLVINTHFDHMGVTARQKSVMMLYKIIKRHQKNFDGIVLMGDFNLSPEEKPIQWLSKRLKDVATETDPRGTFNGFKSRMHALNPGRRIDYIFTLPHIKTSNYTVDYRFRISPPPDSAFGYLSDHYPVSVTVYGP